MKLSKPVRRAVRWPLVVAFAAILCGACSLQAGGIGDALGALLSSVTAGGGGSAVAVSPPGKNEIINSTIRNNVRVENVVITAAGTASVAIGEVTVSGTKLQNSTVESAAVIKNAVITAAGVGAVAIANTRL